MHYKANDCNTTALEDWRHRESDCQFCEKWINLSLDDKLPKNKGIYTDDDGGEQRVELFAEMSVVICGLFQKNSELSKETQDRYIFMTLMIFFVMMLL